MEKNGPKWTESLNISRKMYVQIAKANTQGKREWKTRNRSKQNNQMLCQRNLEKRFHATSWVQASK